MKFCAENSLCKSDKYGISIVYTYHDSDEFYDAKLCKYNDDCICFETQEPVTIGENIYVMTHDYPLDGQSLEIYEGCLARAERCNQIHKMGNPIFQVGARISRSHILDSSEDGM